MIDLVQNKWRVWIVPRLPCNPVIDKRRTRAKRSKAVDDGGLTFQQIRVEKSLNLTMASVGRSWDLGRVLSSV